MEQTLKAAVEAAEQKALELTQQMGVKVHPLVFPDEVTDEPVVGFMQEPKRAVKLAVLDKSVMGGFSAADEMLDLILIKEHSDPRIYSEKSEDDRFRLGAVMAAFELVKFSTNSAKKKN